MLHPGFDPGVATAQYLALQPRTLQAIALAYTRGSHWVLLWGKVASLVACVLIARLGVLPRLRDRLSGRGDRRNLPAFACGLAFLLLLGVIKLPWSGYAEWYREFEYGFTRQTLTAWLGAALIQMAISATIGAVLLVALYALARRFGSRWWIAGSGLGAIAITMAMIVFPVVLAPLFYHFPIWPRSAPSLRTRSATIGTSICSGSASS